MLTRGSTAIVLLFACSCLIEDTPGYALSESQSSSGTGGQTDTDSNTEPDLSDGSGSASSTTGGQPAQPLPPAGYMARGCGFDMDDDFEYSERDDDCRVCDGVTVDPDGDGVPEDMWYVNCDAPGNDTDTCGAPDNPCSTLAHVFSERMERVAHNAPFEDIVCFRGVCNAADRLEMRDGLAGNTKIREPSGSEAVAFEYPGEPFMLVGWDSNENGVYPPDDPEDIAVLDGGPGQLTVAFDFSSGHEDSEASNDVEIAHFTIRNYGGNCDGNGVFDGSIEITDAGAPVNRHIYVHDVVIEDFCKDNESSESAVFDFGSFAHTDPYRGAPYQHIAIENVLITDYGSALFEEGSSHNEFGPIRVKNVTATAHGCDQGGSNACPDDTDKARAVVWRYPGFVDGVELIDNVFDLSADDWIPDLGQAIDQNQLRAPLAAIDIGECSRNVVIRNNRILGYPTAVLITSDSGFDIGCERSVAGVVVDANVVEGNYEPAQNLHAPFYVRGSIQGIPEPQGIDDVSFTNNVVTASHASRACLRVDAALLEGGGGPITAANNTCILSFDADMPSGSNGLIVSLGSDPLPMIVRNNILVGTGDEPIAIFVENMAGFESDRNVIGGGAMFNHLGTTLDLEAWVAASGQGAASVSCDPSFDSADGFHLAADDTCAIGAAMPVSGVQFDIDGDPRPPSGPWDAGADQRVE